MSEIKKPSIARLAVDTIKEAKEAGEELGRMITEVQADNERAVRQYQQRVLRERRQQRSHEQDLDQIAINEWIAEQERIKKVENVKKEIEQTYGRGAWEKIQETKRKIKEIEAQDLKAANELRNRMNDLFWWCLGTAALVTYVFQLYK